MGAFFQKIMNFLSCMQIYLSFFIVFIKWNGTQHVLRKLNYVVVTYIV